MEVRPLSPVLGTEFLGVDLSCEIEDEKFQAIYQASIVNAVVARLPLGRDDGAPLPEVPVEEHLDTLRAQGLLATVNEIEPFDQFI